MGLKPPTAMPLRPSQWPLLYNPLRMSAEDTERFFVARKDVFERLLRAIVEVEAGEAPRHQLIIGQRGMGKTTLMNRLAVELRKMPHAQHFLPLSFWEEQHLEIDRLSDFWAACLDSLANACERAGKMQEAAELDATLARLEGIADETQRADAGRRALADMAASLELRLVLFIDNFNLLLARLRAHDHALRAFFTAPGAPILVAAGLKAPESASDYSAAFYDAFSTHNLRRLSLAEMESMLQTLAALDARPDVAASLRAHHPRLAALRDMTGGNPRVAMLIYRLCSGGFGVDAYADLERLLDEITPLYQSRFDQLSEQGQKLVVRLARHWRPATARQICENLTGFPRGSIGPLVRQLERDGLVETVELFDSAKRQISKKSGYQLAERFFNIWLLMRISNRRDRAGLACLARFIETFFTPEERKQEARRLRGKGTLEHGELVYARALADCLDADGDDNFASGLRTQAELGMLNQSRETRAKLEQIIDFSEIQPKVLEFAELKRRLIEMVPAGASVTGEEFADLVITTPTLLPPGESTRFDIAAMKDASKEQIDRIAEFLRDRKSVLLQALGEGTHSELINMLRGCELTSSDNAQEFTTWLQNSRTAETAKFIAVFCKNTLPEVSATAYRKAIRTEPANAALWTSLGNLLKNHLGRCVESEAAYRKASEIDSTSAAPWNGLGNHLQDHLGRYDESEAAYRKAIEIDPTNTILWNNLGNLLQVHLGRYDESEAAYRKAIEIDSTDAAPWNNLGNLLQDHLGRYEESEAAYCKAIEIDSTKAAPWHNLGKLLQDHLGRYDESEAAHRKAIEIDPTNAMPWNGLGNLHLDCLAQFHEAEAAFLKSLELDPSEDSPRHNLAFLLRDYQNSPGAARAVLAELRQPEEWQDIQALHEALFAAYDQNWGMVREHLKKALAAVNGDGLPASTQDDWCRATAVLVHLGFGDGLVEFLSAEGADMTLLPWFAAARAHAVGDKREILNFPAEARGVAEKLFDAIQRRRALLPPRK
jgi:Flp pilus assembly protein TadD